MGKLVFSDRYEVIEQLGKKPGRKTFLALDCHTQQKVIVKLLLFGDDLEWEHLKLFEREAQTLKNLSHPAIPAYIDYFDLEKQGNGFALVQTYIDAPSLATQLENGRTFSEAELKDLAAQLLKILDYLHTRQPPVIHRDLKPSNILLTNRSGHSVGQVYLVDFGSVQNAAAREGDTMTIVGTYGYMPPEQFGGHTVPASDLYSLGATLIHLMTRIPPAELPQKSGHLQFKDRVQCSRGFQDWLTQMVSPYQDQRFELATAALSALQSSDLQPDIKPRINSLIHKPKGSKVELTQSATALEIYIPPMGFKVELIPTFLFGIAWNSFITFWTAGAMVPLFTVPFPGNLVSIPFLLFSLPFWGAGIGMILAIAFPLWGRIYLRIDKTISLTYKLFGIRYQRPRPSLRESIRKLKRTQRDYKRNSDGDRVEVPPALMIYADTQEYKMSADHTLSEAELDWLAQELSQWLNLPLDSD